MKHPIVCPWGGHCHLLFSLIGLLLLLLLKAKVELEHRWNSTKILFLIVWHDIDFE